MGRRRQSRSGDFLRQRLAAFTLFCRSLAGRQRLIPHLFLHRFPGQKPYCGKSRKDFVARFSMRSHRKLVAHRARGNEQRRLLA